jgi:hypothetical protein
MFSNILCRRDQVILAKIVTNPKNWLVLAPVGPEHKKAPGNSRNFAPEPERVSKPGTEPENR